MWKVYVFVERKDTNIFLEIINISTMFCSAIPMKWFLGALLSSTFAILSLIWTPYQLVLEERLRMRQGLPTFDWWYNPPDVIRLKIYLFNVTNAERYLSGEDVKLKLEEIGPIVFREIVTHSNVVYNENDTISYTLSRKLILDPSLNSINLNTTLMFPNLPVLLTASLFWNTNYLMKMILNSGFEVTKSKIIVKKTIYEILYDNTDPFLDIAHLTMPSQAVFNNVGLLPVVFPGYKHRMTVYMGTKFGHQSYLLINKFNGSVNVPGIGPRCKDNIVNASNNIIYSQLMSKSTRIKYLNELLCRSIPLTFEEEVYNSRLKAYKFVVTRDAFNRIQPPEDDCYKSLPALPDGLTDMSSCWFSYPVVGSYPHFIYGSSILQTYVDGMKPNISKHRSFGIFEPITGITLKSRAIMQINLYIKPLKDFHRIFARFSNASIIPAFIIESTHDAIPYYILIVIHIVVWLPTIGLCLSIIMLIFGFYCMWRLKSSWNRRKHKYAGVEISDKNSHFEQRPI